MRKLITAVLVVAMLSFAPAANAQDLWNYLKTHSSLVGGAVVVDDQKEQLVEFRVTDTFDVVEKVKADVRVGLFSINRAGETKPVNLSEIPSTLEQVKAYSDGEVWVSAYRPFTPTLAAVCIGGVTFKMISVIGTVGDPLEGTKVAGGCGVRFTGTNNGVVVDVVGGHYGPVSENDHIAGFIPNLIINGHIPLRFIGKNTAFVPDLAFGAKKPLITDPDQRRIFTRTLRLGIETRF